jgi:hypothetical protein
MRIKATIINVIRNMSFVKKYGTIIAIVLPLALLVVIRSLGTNHFRNDGRKLYAPSINHANIITSAKLNDLSGEKLLISLSELPPANAVANVKSIYVPADSIISKKYLKVIKGNDGPVILFSSDEALSARIWMVLAQLGIKDILILNYGNDYESLKYQFRPDTSAD